KNHRRGPLMRNVLFALVAALGCAVAAGAQGIKAEARKDEGKEPKSLLDTITQVGGKSLEQWIKEIHSSDPSRREAAMRTILMFGPPQAAKAVPDLLKELKKHTPTTPIDLSVRVSGATALAAAVSSSKEPNPADVKEA